MNGRWKNEHWNYFDYLGHRTKNEGLIFIKFLITLKKKVSQILLLSKLLSTLMMIFLLIMKD